MIYIKKKDIQKIIYDAELEEYELKFMHYNKHEFIDAIRSGNRFNLKAGNRLIANVYFKSVSIEDYNRYSEIVLVLSKRQK